MRGSNYIIFVCKYMCEHNNCLGDIKRKNKSLISDTVFGVRLKRIKQLRETRSKKLRALVISRIVVGSCIYIYKELVWNFSCVTYRDTPREPPNEKIERQSE